MKCCLYSVLVFLFRLFMLIDFFYLYVKIIIKGTYDNICIILFCFVFFKYYLNKSFKRINEELKTTCINIYFDQVFRTLEIL